MPTAESPPLPSPRDGGTGADADLEIAAPIHELAIAARELDALPVAADAEALAERVAAGMFFVACIGQFNRGKSSLLNALVGDSVLPTGIVPVTSVPTVLRYGTARAARVRLRDGTWSDVDPGALERFVSEEHNPENALGVLGVEVRLPSPLLASGMCLVDTPGLGSAFAGNAAATHAFVPQVDAAIVVVGADPPISGDELRLVEVVARQVSDVLIVLNKADKATPDERREALAFTRRMLAGRLGREPGPIFEVSALERMHDTGPPRDWDALVDSLGQLVRRSGRALARSALDRGRRRIAARLCGIIAAERAALLEPGEAWERRMEDLDAVLHDAEQALAELGLRFTAEQQRLARTFADRRAAFESDVLHRAQAELELALRDVTGWWGPAVRRRTMDAAITVARRHVLPWLQSEEQEGARRYRQAASRFTAMANDLLHRFSESTGGELAGLPEAVADEAGFRMHSRFAFHEMLRIAHPASPLRAAGDVFVVGLGLRSPVLRDAREFLALAIEVNAARVQSDLDDRLRESRVRLEAEIREALAQARRVGERALEHARGARAAGAEAVRGALQRLDRLEERVRAASAA